MISQVEFSQIARSLQQECARLGLKAPAFRSHPKRGTRALHRHSEQTVVLIALGRDVHEVTGDMIDGCLASQSEPLDAETTETLRGALWIAAGEAVAA